MSFNADQLKFHFKNLRVMSNNVEPNEFCFKMKVTPIKTITPSDILQFSRDVLDPKWPWKNTLGKEMVSEVSKCLSQSPHLTVLTPVPSELTLPSLIGAVRFFAASLSSFQSELIITAPDIFRKILEIKNNILYTIKPIEYSPQVTYLPGSVTITLEGSDLDAVMEMIIQCAFPLKKASHWKLLQVLVQESIFEEFNIKLQAIFSLITEREEWFNQPKNKIALEWAKKTGAKIKVFGSQDSKFSAIIYDAILPNDYIGKYTINVLPFRSASEVVTLAKTVKHFCTASIWGGDVSLLTSVAQKLDCSTVWLNSFGRTHHGVTLCWKCDINSVKESIPQIFPNEEPFTFKQEHNDYPLKLMLCKELSPYRHIIARAMNNLATPKGNHIIVRTIGPIGIAEIIYTEGNIATAKYLIILALALGNQVLIKVAEETNQNELDQLIETLSKLLPPAAIRKNVLSGSAFNELRDRSHCIVDSKYGRRKQLLIDSDLPLPEQDIIGQLVHSQFIWLPDPQVI